MYSFLLALHSLTRWLVLISLLFAIYRSWRGWLFHKEYTRTDSRARTIVEVMANIQLVIGVWLYFISPVVSYFFANFSVALHQREFRFFGMEHVTVMLTALVLIIIGSAKASRKRPDQEKFRIMAIWFSIGLLLIISSIPWSFSPLTHRPLFRSF